MNSAALTVLAEAGIVGVEAEVALRHFLAELTAPSSRSAAILDAVGLDRGQLDPSTRSTSTIVRQLAAANLSPDQIETLFGERFSAAVTALLDGSARLDQLSAPG